MFSRYLSFRSICHSELLMFAGHLPCWVFLFFYCKPNAALSFWCFQVICHSNSFSKPSLVLSFDLFKSFTVLNLWFGEIICHAVQFILFFFPSHLSFLVIACGMWKWPWNSEGFWLLFHSCELCLRASNPSPMPSRTRRQEARGIIFFWFLFFSFFCV